MIANWNEKRIVTILVSILIVIGCVYSTFGTLTTPDEIDTINQYLPNYNQVSVPMYHKGQFCDDRMPNELSYGIMSTTTIYFIQFILLAFALNA